MDSDNIRHHVGNSSPARRTTAVGRHVSALRIGRFRTCNQVERTVQVGDNVEIKCTGTIVSTGKDARLFKNDTCSFTVGQTQQALLLPAISEQIQGLRINDSIKFTMDPGEPMSLEILLA